MSRFRRTVLAGLFLTVPLVVTVAALVWLFGIVDGLTAPFTTPLVSQVLGRESPTALVRLLAAAMGVVITFLVLLGVGAFATNVIGRRIVARTEAWLMKVPVFRAIYAPVKQLVAALSPHTEGGFKRVVMVDDPRRGWVLGFLTKEFTIARDHDVEALLAVYVPTNHLYLGDVLVCSRDRAFFPAISVREGVQLFLTGGASMPAVLEHLPEAATPTAPEAASPRGLEGDRRSRR